MSTSFQLKAAKLLSNYDEFDFVYLLPRSYIENWIIWVLKSIKVNGGSQKNKHIGGGGNNERKSRIYPENKQQEVIKENLKAFQTKYKLKNYSTFSGVNGDEFQPSPIDCSSISEEISDTKCIKTCLKKGLRPNFDVIPVSEGFYELLRSVHGVRCRRTEGKESSLIEVSYQSSEENEIVALEHSLSDLALTKRSNIPLEYRRRILDSSLAENDKECFAKIDKARVCELVSDADTFCTIYNCSYAKLFVTVSTASALSAHQCFK